MQRIVIKYIINIFSGKFVWLKPCSTKNCKKFAKHFYWLLLQVNFFWLWSWSFWVPKWRKIQEKNFMDLTFCENCTFVKLKIFLPVVSFMKYALELKIGFGSLCLHSKKLVWIGLLFAKKLLLFRTITLTVYGATMKRFHSTLIYLCLLSQALTIHKTVWGGRNQFCYFLTFLLSHEHRDIFLQFCIWDD